MCFSRKTPPPRDSWGSVKPHRRQRHFWGGRRRAPCQSGNALAAGHGKALGCWGAGLLLCLSAPPAILPSPSCWLFPFHFPLLPPALGALPALPPLASPQMGGEKWFSPCETSPFSWLCFPCRMLRVLIYSLCFSRTYSDGILLSSIYGRETIYSLSFLENS